MLVVVLLKGKLKKCFYFCMIKTGQMLGEENLFMRECANRKNNAVKWGGGGEGTVLTTVPPAPLTNHHFKQVRLTMIVLCSRYDRYGGGQQSGRFGSYGNVFSDLGPYGMPQSQASFPYNMAPYGMYGQQFPGNYPANSQSAAGTSQQQQQQPPQQQQHRQGGPFSPVGSPIGYQGYPAQFAQFGQQPVPPMPGSGAGYHTGYQDRPPQHSSSTSSNSAGNTQ